MNSYVILATSLVAALSLVVAGIACFYYRKLKLDKDRRILQHLRHYDMIEKELEQTRIEKATLEKALRELGNGEAHSDKEEKPDIHGFFLWSHKKTKKR